MQFQLSRHPIAQLLLFGTLGIGLLVIGYFAIDDGFDAFNEIHQLAPMSATPVESVGTGPVIVEGVVDEYDELLTTGVTDTPSVLTRFVQESYVRGDDGREWSTQSDRVHTVPFVVRGDHDEVIVDPGDEPLYEAPERHHETDDRQRYTEYRIEPGDEVVVTGWATPGDNGETTISLDLEDDLPIDPLVSTEGIWPLQESRIFRALFSFGLGILVLLAGLLCLLRAARVTRSTYALVVMTAGVCAVLLWVGFQSAQHTVEQRLELSDMIDGSTQEAFDAAADEQDLDDATNWRDDHLEQRIDGVPDGQRQQLMELREASASTLARIDDEIQQFPYSLYYTDPAVLDVPDIEYSAAPPAASAPMERLSAPSLIGMAFLLIVALYALRRGLRRIELMRIIESIAPTDIAGTTYGINAWEVRFRADDMMFSPVSGTPCIWYEHQFEQGDDKKTHVNSVDHFQLIDDTGCIDVDPDWAEKVAPRTAGVPLIGEQEWCLPADAESLYILGPATIDPETHDSLQICWDSDLVIDDLGDTSEILDTARENLEKRKNNNPPFLLSSFDADEVQFRIGRAGITAIGISIWAMAMLGFVASIYLGGRFEVTDMVYATILSGTYLAGCLAMIIYNTLVFLDNRAQKAWANIEVALKKRVDATEALLPIIEGIGDHDGEIQRQVARLRSDFDELNIGPADVRRGAEISRREHQLTVEFEALAEEYPNIASDQHFAELMETLRDLEKDVELMREGYNSAVKRYNTSIERFPDIIVAKLTSMTPRQQFTDSDTADSYQ